MKTLKPLFLFIFLINVIFSSTFSQTNVSGDVSGTWTKAGSPYIVTANISVASNDTLIIKPGVVVKFSASTNMYISGSGRCLIVQGKQDSMVLFTSNLPGPTAGDWDGISIGSGAIVALSNCIIEYANYGIYGSASASGCSSRTTTFSIDSSTIRYNNYGIRCFADGATAASCACVPFSNGNVYAKVTHCRIYNNLYDGINYSSWDGDCSSGYIGGELKYNQIYQNGDHGINCFGESSVIPQILSNTIYNNGDCGIKINNDYIVVKNNIIANNDTGIYSVENAVDAFIFNNVWNNTINHSGLTVSASNFSSNPLFVDASNYDFNLTASSPCIDQGDTSMIDSLDGTRFDVGAISYIKTPAKTTIIEPENDTLIISENIYCIWDKLGKINLYELQIASDLSFENLIYDTLVNITNFQPGNVNTGKQFFWRVRAVNYKGNGTWSDVGVFRYIDETRLLPQIMPSKNNVDLPVSVWKGYAVVGKSDDSNKGCVYLYKRNIDNWEFSAKLFASDGSTGDAFGSSVFIKDDFIFVGATGDDDKGASSGSVYVFKREDTTYQQISKIVPSDGNASDAFGAAVAYDNNTLMIGSTGDDNAGINTGSVYFYRNDNDDWIFKNLVTANPPNDNSRFGGKVSISSYYAIASSVEYEQVFIFHYNNNNWQIQTKIQPEGIYECAYYGSSVSIYNDYAIVGAPGTPEHYYGFAYIYKKDNNTWKKQTRISPLDSIDGFGRAVSIYGDYLLISSPREEISGVYNGQSYIYKRNDSTWVEYLKLSTKNEVISNRNTFGFHVALDNNNAMIGGQLSENFYSVPAFAHIYTDVTVVPSAPLQLEPADQVIDCSNQVNFKWYSDEMTPVFQLQIATDSYMNTIANEISGLGISNYTIDLENNSVYYWRVRFNHNSEVSNWSGIWKLQTQLATPLLIFPADQHVSAEPGMSFNWHEVDGATKYSLQVSTDSLFLRNITYYNSNLTDTFVSVPVFNNNTYYWKVKANNTTSQSNWSEKWRFTTNDVTSINDHADADGIFIFPNPFNDVLKIEGLKDQKSTVTVYSLEGKLLKQTQGMGINQMDLTGFQSGTYMLTIICKNTVITRKIVKL